MAGAIVDDPGSRKRFELEARVRARIRSDHAAEVIASGVDRSARPATLPYQRACTSQASRMKRSTRASISARSAGAANP
jgi:hypothetical protein